MKLDIVRTGERMQLTIDGHTLSQQEPQMVFTVSELVALLFVGAPHGIVAQVHCCGAPCKEVVFRGGAGVEGWARSAEQLKKDVQDILDELERGTLPGCSIDIPITATYVDAQRIATMNPPGKQLVGANGAPIKTIVKG